MNEREEGRSAFRHSEIRQFGTRLVYTLASDGILEEEFTAGLRTHSRLVPYEDIWDVYWTRRIPPLAFVLPVLLGAGSYLSFLWGGTWPAIACSFAAGGLLGFILGRGWVLVFTVFDHEGNWLMTLRGRSNRMLESFMESLLKRMGDHCYPLMRTLENLPMGEEVVKTPFRTWACSFRYDRMVVETRGPWKWGKRVYYSLSALRPPVRLRVRIPWLAVGLMAMGPLVHGGMRWFAPSYFPEAAAPWLWIGSVLGALGTLYGGRVVVSMPAGPSTLQSPGFFPFRSAAYRRILLWFSRVANISEYLEDLRSEDFWDYHRRKVQILYEHGFLEDWPYRSALSKINANEKQETGG